MIADWRQAIIQTFELLWLCFGALNIKKNWQSVSRGMQIPARWLGIQVVQAYEAKVLDICCHESSDGARARFVGANVQNEPARMNHLVSEPLA
ncbi:MAG: hypothetical protein ACREC9_09850 [Methylocella sp.]